MGDQLQLWDDTGVVHNVFFAVQPDRAAAARAEYVAHDFIKSRRMAAKVLPPERFHVSLFGVGGFSDQLPPAVIEAAEAAASTVSAAPFTVVFDRIASFGGGRGNRALVLTGSEGVVGLVRFQEAISLAMAKAGVGGRQKQSFTPHMTLMYTDETCDMPIEPISWTVDEFVLIDSPFGRSRHDLLGRWSL